MSRERQPNDALLVEVRDLVERVARRDVSLHASWDENTRGMPDEDRRHDALAMLRAGHLVKAAAQQAINAAVTEAVYAGADFGEIGDAEGITRQAARQRYRRWSTRRAVRLVGGPRDGEASRVFGTEREVRFVERAGFWDVWYDWRGGDDWDGWDKGAADRPTSVYRAKYGSPGIFEFAHYEDTHGRVVEDWDWRPRVRQLARYWHVETETILRRAHEVDPTVRNPSSRVEQATVDALEEMFDPHRDDRAGT